MATIKPVPNSICNILNYKNKLEVEACKYVNREISYKEFLYTSIQLLEEWRSTYRAELQKELFYENLH